MNNNVKIEALKTFAASEGYNQFTDEGVGSALEAYLNGVGYAKVLTWLAHSNIVPVGTTWDDVADVFGASFEEGFAEASEDFGG